VCLHNVVVDLEVLESAANHLRSEELLCSYRGVGSWER